MKNLILAVVLGVAVLGTVGARAEEVGASHLSDFGFGIGWGSFGGDSGSIFDLTSPRFSRDHLAIRLALETPDFHTLPAGGQEYFRHSYNVLGLGMVGTVVQSDPIRVYVEPSVLWMIAPHEIRDVDLAGLEAAVGVEFYPSRAWWTTVFFEVGTQFFFTGQGDDWGSARATNVSGRPFFGTGATVSGGLRFYF